MLPKPTQIVRMAYRAFKSRYFAKR